jgi:hypothetical protein
MSFSPLVGVAWQDLHGAPGWSADEVAPLLGAALTVSVETGVLWFVQLRSLYSPWDLERPGGSKDGMVSCELAVGILWPLAGFE